jgi:hypothetical protein
MFIKVYIEMEQNIEKCRLANSLTWLRFLIVDETAGKKRRYGKRNQTDDAIAPVKDIVKNEETLKRYKLREVEGVGEGAESEEGVGAIMSDTAHIRKVGPIDPIRDFKAMIDPAKGDFISEGK